MAWLWSHCANDEVWVDESDVWDQSEFSDEDWESLFEQERYING